MNLQNLQQKNGMLFMIRLVMQAMEKEMKIVQVLNLKQKKVKSSLCNYSDAYIILVTGHVAARNSDTDTNIAFKNWPLFTKCLTLMWNSIEYSDNYSDVSVSLWQFKSDEWPVTNAGDHGHVSADDSSFKYKSSILVKPAANEVLKL